MIHRVTDLMDGLADTRPMFHSEADFQHALAWRIHEVDSDPRIRLEWPVKLPGRRNRIYLDLWLPGSNIAVELKYLTRKLKYEHEDECFALRDQGAQDTRRYDFLKDIQRLEQLCLSDSADVRAGFAILLTNDPLYWEEPSSDWKKAIDAAFRIHEGLTKEGCMAWSEVAGPGTIKGRKDRVCLNGSYRLEWQDYKDLGDVANRRFRYLAIPVGCRSTLNAGEPC